MAHPRVRLDTRNSVAWESLQQFAIVHSAAAVFMNPVQEFAIVHLACMRCGAFLTIVNPTTGRNQCTFAKRCSERTPHQADRGIWDFRGMHYRKFLHEIRESHASRCTIAYSFRGDAEGAILYKGQGSSARMNWECRPRCPPPGRRRRKEPLPPFPRIAYSMGNVIVTLVPTPGSLHSSTSAL